MSKLADDINSQITAGRQTIQRAEDDTQGKGSMNQVPRPIVMATGLAVFVAAVGVGWMVYRRRRRNVQLKKLAAAQLASVADLTEALAAKARRPIERVVRRVR